MNKDNRIEVRYILLKRIVHCISPDAAPVGDESEDVLDVGVGHNLAGHHQLVPVLLVPKHSPGKFNPDMMKVSRQVLSALFTEFVKVKGKW